VVTWNDQRIIYPMELFGCLATVLLQPEPPASIIIDEPELGLHPY